MGSLAQISLTPWRLFPEMKSSASRLGDYIQMLLQYLSLVIHLGAYNKTKLRFVRKKRDSPERRCLLSICWRVHGSDVLKFLNLQYTYDVPKQHFQEEKYSSWQRSLIGSQRLFFCETPEIIMLMIPNAGIIKM